MTTRRNTRRNFSIESLEKREVMAANFTAALADGVLAINGSEQADTIIVRQANNQITIDGFDGKFDASKVTALKIDARGGDDVISLNTVGHIVDKPSMIDAGAGNDFVRGGRGNDIVNLGAGDDYASTGGGDDIVFGGAGNDLIYTHDGNDLVYGDDGDDVITLHQGDDVAYGGAGKDKIFASAGNDRIDGGSDSDELYGGAGDDHILGGNGADSIWAEDGNDRVEAGSGDDQVRGGAGNDTLYGEAGADTVFGELGNDLIIGGDGSDTLRGGDGDDRLYGEAGDDWLYGDAGSDNLFGGDGSDQLYGGLGDDQLTGGAGRDGLYGEEGYDAFYDDYFNTPDDRRWSLFGTKERWNGSTSNQSLLLAMALVASRTPVVPVTVPPLVMPTPNPTIPTSSFAAPIGQSPNSGPAYSTPLTGLLGGLGEDFERAFKVSQEQMAAYPTMLSWAVAPTGMDFDTFSSMTPNYFRSL